MKNIEYQAFIKLRDNVWTTVFQEIVQDWTRSKCNVIVQQVTSVTNLGIDAKSIQRFAKLLENQVATNQTKYILAMFLTNQKANPQVDKKGWYQFVQDFQSERQQNVASQNPMVRHAGEYVMYYKSIYTSSLNANVNIALYENGQAIYHGISENYEGKVYLMPGNPTLFFVFKSLIEYFFIIVQLDVTHSSQHSSHLMGIFSALKQRAPSNPYACYVVLVKKDALIDLERIHAYFDTIGTNHKISLEESLTKILNSRIPLQHAIEPNIKRLSHFMGNWYIYSHSFSDPNAINRAVLIIKSTSEISYRSIFNVSTGKIKLKGGTKVIIELENEDIQAQIILNIQHRQLLNFHQEKCLFTSTGVNKPITGIAILEKVDIDAEMMTEKAIHPSDAAYQVLQQKGIIAELKAMPDIYL